MKLFRNKIRKFLQPKSIDQLEEIQEYFLIHKDVYVSKEEIAEWCINVCHKKVMKEGHLG